MKILLALVVALALLAVGCGDGSPDSKADQPAPNVTGFAVSGFGTIPRYPRSRAISKEFKSDNGVLTRTFVVPGTEQNVIFQYYVDVLPRQGWHAVTTGADSTPSRRGVWKKDGGGQHLVVATSGAPTVDSNPAAHATEAQYSILLYPAGVPVNP